MSHISMTAELPWTPVISHMKTQRHSRSGQTHLCSGGGHALATRLPPNLLVCGFPSALISHPHSSSSWSCFFFQLFFKWAPTAYTYPLLNSPPLLYRQAYSQD